MTDKDHLPISSINIYRRLYRYFFLMLVKREEEEEEKK